MKKWHIVAAVVSILLVLIFFILSSRGFSFASGTYLRTSDGNHLILDGKSPIVMSARNVTFQGLKTGDTIWILHDGIEDSYPARTGVYFLIRHGQSSYIDETALQQLAELGWIIEPLADCTNGG